MAALEGRRQSNEPGGNQKHQFLHPVVEGGGPYPPPEGGAVRHPELGHHRPVPSGAPRPPVQGEVAQRDRSHHREAGMDAGGRRLYSDDAQENRV